VVRLVVLNRRRYGLRWRVGAATGRGMQSLRSDVQFGGAIGGESNAVPSAEYLAGAGAMLRMG